VTATVFELEVLRCCLCGKTFTAPTPPEAGVQKYDPSVGVMVGQLRYGSGMPFYRLVPCLSGWLPSGLNAEAQRTQRFPKGFLCVSPPALRLCVLPVWQSTG